MHIVLLTVPVYNVHKVTTLLQIILTSAMLHAMLLTVINVLKVVILAHVNSVNQDIHFRTTVNNVNWSLFHVGVAVGTQLQVEIVSIIGLLKWVNAYLASQDILCIMANVTQLLVTFTDVIYVHHGHHLLYVCNANRVLCYLMDTV